jgi:hypothetical protein
LGAIVGIVIGVVIVVAVVTTFILARTSQPRLTRVVPLSHLKCPKCGTEFDYAWIPGASLTSIRLAGWRILSCPVCRKFSVFNIWKTRVDPETHHCPIRVGPS